MYALRAATTVEANTIEAIKAAMDEIWQSFIAINSFEQTDIISVIVSATKDISAAYPASFIRKAGCEEIALLDLCQLTIENEIPMCLRLLVYSKKPGRNLYLRGAKALRPEWGLEQMEEDLKKSDLEARSELLNIKPYVPGKPIEEVQREFGLNEVIKLASNENPYGPSKKAVAAMAEKIMHVNLYPDGSSYELKKKLAAFYSLDSSNFIVGNGSDEIIKMISETYLADRDNILTADITFSEYEFGALLMGAKVKKVPLKNFTHDLEGFLKNIDDRTKLCYICNPNNPTGTMVTHTELVRFLDQLPRGILVVLDEAYAEYVDHPDYPDFKKLIEQYPIIVLRTFSKIYGLAGLRIGVGIAAKEIIQDIERTREPFNVNLIAQAAAVSTLEDTEYRDYCYRENIRIKREFYKRCKELKIEYVESQTNFVLIKVACAPTLVQALLTKGVIVRSGKSFGLPDYIRVSLGTAAQMQKFWQAFAEVRDGGIKE